MCLLQPAAIMSYLNVLWDECVYDDSIVSVGNLLVKPRLVADSCQYHVRSTKSYGISIT